MFNVTIVYFFYCIVYMNYQLASYFHLVHTVFINTYQYIDIRLIPIWIIHITIILLSSALTNYTCPITIVETRIKSDNDKNKIGEISNLTNYKPYKIFVIVWFFTFLLLSFYKIGILYYGVIYVTTIGKSLYLINQQKWNHYLYDCNINTLLRLLYLYIGLFGCLVSYIGYFIYANLLTY